MQVLTRSDGVPDNANFGETTNGIEFTANSNGAGSLSIASVVASAGTTLVTTPMAFLPNEPYAFDIMDDGNSVSLTMTELGGSHVTATVSRATNLRFDQNHIVFHNRESNNGGINELAYLDDLTITSTLPNPLTYSLDPGAPMAQRSTAGRALLLDAHRGQGPGTYTIAVRVTDNGSPP